MERISDERKSPLGSTAGVVLALFLITHFSRSMLRGGLLQSVPAMIVSYIGVILLIVGFVLRKKTNIFVGLGFAAMAFSALLALLFTMNQLEGGSALVLLPKIQDIARLFGFLVAIIALAAGMLKSHKLCAAFFVVSLILLFIDLVLSFVPGLISFGPCAVTSLIMIRFPDILLFAGVFIGVASIIEPIAAKESLVFREDGSVELTYSGYVSMVLHIVLILFTFGIWSAIWVYRTTRYTNQVKDLEKRIPIRKLLLCLFVPFYIIYWNYVTAKRIDMIAEENGVKTDAKIAVLCLVFSFLLNIAPPIIMQSRINKISKSIR